MALFTPNIDKLREKNDIQGLLKLTKHRKAEVRLNALLALVKTRDQSVTQELKKLINDPDPRVRTIATIKFGDINDPAIIENLR
ncbi:MAG TPA: HEAT repeat domain-containing protein, partial [Spirochaetota bacterium]|nr:HEAT repeat domain-containing protein [Spirochaetota bacterium]